MNRRSMAALVLAVALAFAAKVVVTSRTYGATDILFWEAFAGTLQNKGVPALYREGAVLYKDGRPFFNEEFNHPPFMTRVLTLWSTLAAATGLPFRFWLRFSSAVADVVSVVLLAAIVRRPRSLLLIILSPVSFLVSGFHGNTDPIMVAFILLCVYLLSANKPAWLAGAALGMAANFKILPVVFAPAVLFFLPDHRKRLQFAAGAAAVFLAASLPWIVQEPFLIWQHVFGYTPQAGVWGFARLAASAMAGEHLPVYARVAKVALLAVLFFAAWWMNYRTAARPPIEQQIGLLSFTFLALTPGFGVQYLVWLVPWTALLTVPQAFLFHLAGSVFLFSYYDRAAQGFPWYLANSAATPVWYGSVVYCGLLCWIAVCWLAIVLWQRITRGS